MDAREMIEQLKALPPEALTAPLELDTPVGRFAVTAVNYETDIEVPTTYVEGEWE